MRYASLIVDINIKSRRGKILFGFFAGNIDQHGMGCQFVRDMIWLKKSKFERQVKNIFQIPRKEYENR